MNTDITELTSELNDMQRAAVEYNDGPMLVIAGAGSGKTRMLTHKIAYLIAQGVKAWNILALTFTNKAANEMKERIGQLVGADCARYINMGTFHSVFARILRIEAQALGFTPQYTIYDESDAQNLIKSIIREMGLDDKIYRPSAVHKRISLAKNNMISAGDYISDAQIYERDRQARLPSLGKIFTAYEQRCKRANAADFDDLLLLTYRLFRDNDEVRGKWEDRFQYILVDEYQDTNKAQQAVLGLLTRTNRHICVVGDDAQSIYAFRGACLENILLFHETYPEAKLFKLERNYRSTQRIVEAANSLIRHNERQISKDVFSENESGERLQLKHAYSDAEEANIVCTELERIQREDDCEYSDFAILYRTNAQSRTFEEALRKRDIPYCIYGGLSFYQRKEIKDIIAYFRLTVNPDDEEAFRRIVNYPARGIGATSLARIGEAAARAGTGLWRVCIDADKHLPDMSNSTRAKIAGFVRLISSFRERAATEDAFTLGQDIIKQSGIYADIFSSTDDEALTRQENISEFGNALNTFVEDLEKDDRRSDATLERFLQEVSLQSDKENGDKEDTARVALMTVHAAKGLEFATVFIVGLDENIFPSQRACSSQRELEEERRLLYVAITRAAKHCILTCAKNRWRYGKPEYFVPSRFINEIDSRYIASDENGRNAGKSAAIPLSKRRTLFASPVQNSRPVATQFRADPKYKITRERPKETPADPFGPAFRKQLDAAHGKQTASASSAGKRQARAYKGLREGMTIEHERFGRGTVVQLDGTDNNMKATVDFDNAGRKQLLLKFAKYSIVQ
ncbi:MAG: UvrD-helicase domain-containing protein [Prevotella sp.]|nr:UvrD-helicase domain-containing protein [Prevotella sp.]